MSGAPRGKQIRIYTGKCFRVFFNEKGWKIFISAALITLLISLVSSDEMFVTYQDTRSGAFALVCACIWIGIFNSIQSVCKERDIIKREHRSGLHISSYIMSHVIFEMVLCLIESIIVALITYFSCVDNIPSEGVCFPIVVELSISFFIIIFSSDVLGLMVSSIVKNPNTAMTVMPFILIIQLIMSGMIFELEGVTETISKITIAKWGLNAICTTANVNAMEFSFPDLVSDYKYTTGHLMSLWVLLLAFAALYAILAIISLKFIDKDKR